MHCLTCDMDRKPLTYKVIGGISMAALVCGHSQPGSKEDVKAAVTFEPSNLEDYLGIKSESGKVPYKYQAESALFAEQSNISCLIAHEMGLGKTICALAVLGKHYRKLAPILIVTKAGILRQWESECVEWLDEMPWRISNTKDPIPPKAKLYIISYDMLSRFEIDQLPKFKTVIFDECQQLMNPAANRSVAARDISRNATHVIGLSGTPIKNNAAEYFTILNILRPMIFPKKDWFIREYCEYTQYSNGTKVGGLTSWGEDRFRNITKPFILRYTRDQVLPDLPKIKRATLIADLSDAVREAYAKTVIKLLDEAEDMTHSAAERATNILAYMTKMRHLTGLSKIESCVEHVDDFLQSTDRPVTIFAHHQDVIEITKLRLEKLGYKVLTLTGSMNGDERASVVKRFAEYKTTGNRILLASMLAAGEGLNLQFCSDAFVLERQWNPANEEQAEGRFSRIGSEASHIDVTYAVAAGTIDEFFAELVEKKRSYVSGTLDGIKLDWNEQSIMSDLTNMLIKQGRSKWKL